VGLLSAKFSLPSIVVPWYKCLSCRAFISVHFMGRKAMENMVYGSTHVRLKALSVSSTRWEEMCLKSNSPTDQLLGHWVRPLILGTVCGPSKHERLHITSLKTSLPWLLVNAIFTT